MLCDQNAGDCLVNETIPHGNAASIICMLSCGSGFELPIDLHLVIKQNVLLIKIVTFSDIVQVNFANHCQVSNRYVI